MTIRERLDYWRFLLKLERHVWTERVQLWTANRAPRWLVYWIVIRAYTVVWSESGDTHPDELTFDQVARRWQTGRRA